MLKYEYRILPIYKNDICDDVQATLNDIVKNVWEVVAANKDCIYLKRTYFEKEINGNNIQN